MQPSVLLGLALFQMLLKVLFVLSVVRLAEGELVLGCRRMTMEMISCPGAR